jgi:hypothetical protein
MPGFVRPGCDVAMPHVFRFVATLSLTLLLVGHASRAVAQSAPATIDGIVETAGGPVAGAPVSDATVTLQGPGLVHSVRTNARGQFLARVEPGLYRVQITSPGTQGVEWPAVHVRSGQHLRLRGTLVSAPAGSGVTPTPARPLSGDSTTAFTLDEPLLGRLPLDRRDALAAVSELWPGVADGSILGAGANTGSPRRVDGIDLSDPLDGRAWTSYIATSASLVTLQASAPAAEGGAVGAVIDVVTRAGGNRTSGLVEARGTSDALRGDNLSEALLDRNPLLADRDAPLSDTDVSGWLGGPLRRDRAFFSAAIGYGRDRDDPLGPRTIRQTSTLRAQGRLAVSHGDSDVLNGAVFFDDRSASGLAGPEVARVITDAVANRFDGQTLAARLAWQRVLSRSLQLRATWSWLDGSGETAPDALVAGHLDEATGIYTGSQGRRQQSNRLRHIVGASLTAPVDFAGAHTLEGGFELESSRIEEATHYIDDRLFIDFGGRPNLEIDWAGAAREGSSRRLSAYAQDAWTPAARVTVNAGVRVDRFRGATPDIGTVYEATSLQPRAGITVALDGAGRTTARVHYGRYAEPLWFSHYDRATPGVAPVVSYEILANGARREVERVTTPVYTVAAGLRHPRIDETSFGVTHRLTSRLTVAATGVLRDAGDVVDAVFPDARWVAQVRPGLSGRTLTVYRWINRLASEGNGLITNVDGVSYLGPTGATIGSAAASRRYRGVIVDGRYDDGQGRFLVWGAWTHGQNDGTIDDTFAANTSRSGRFASPSAAIVNVDGRATLTPAQKVTLLGSARIPWVGAQVSGLYTGRTGRRYAAVRQFGNDTLDFPQSADGRQVLLETRGARNLEVDHTVALRGEYSVRIAGRRALTFYVDVLNLLNRATVLEVETLYPFASAGGAGLLVFEAPTRLREPRQIYIGGRWQF